MATAFLKPKHLIDPIQEAIETLCSDKIQAVEIDFILADGQIDWDLKQIFCLKGKACLSEEGKQFIEAMLKGDSLQ